MIPPENVDQCQAAVFIGTGQLLELQTFPVPQPAANEALVRVECCTLCGSDLHTISGKRNEPTPSILGHEILGIVTQVGDPPLRDLEQCPLQIGDRVTWSTAVSCGKCPRCTQGLPQKCLTLVKYGHAIASGPYALSGGLAEFLLLRNGSAVVKVPADIPAEVICPVNCATATVVAAFRVAGTITGKRVLIFGAGMLGLTAAAYAKTQGASLVAICDNDEVRLNRTRDFGSPANCLWSASAEERAQRLLAASGHTSFDIVLELSGAADAVEAAFVHTDVGAVVLLVGSVMKSRPVQLDPESVIRRCLAIYGVHNYIPADLRTAVNFLQAHSNRFPFANLVEQSYRLSDINSAVEAAVRERPIRIAIRP